MNAFATPMSISLPEALLLLATDDQTGSIDTGAGGLDYGLAGAILAEMAGADRVRDRDGKLEAIGGPGLNDPILDAAFEQIATSKPRTAKDWVSRLSRDHLKDRILQRLVEGGLLRVEAHRILWVFPANRYPAVDSAVEIDIRESIREAVFSFGTRALSPRTSALIGLLDASNLTGTVFSKDERTRYKQVIDDIATSEVMGEAVARVIRDAQAVVIAAAVTASVAATTAGSS